MSHDSTARRLASPPSIGALTEDRNVDQPENCLQRFLDFSLYVTKDRRFHNFIFLTTMLPCAHDAAIRCREIPGVRREGPLLDDSHALVDFAQAGSIAGAAARLPRTPSAVTRQLQR